MRIKEAKVCCAFAWSTVPSEPGLIASGSVAGAMDDDFSADAHLEIRGVHLMDTTSLEMPVLGRTSMPDRVHRIDWGNCGGPRGTIAAGFVDGGVSLYSVDTLMNNHKNSGEEDPLVAKITQHTAGVKAIQFNPLQNQLLATGGMDKELFIWNLQDTANPQLMPSCAKSTHPAELTDLRWNTRFPHILGTATSSGLVTVWDLKAKRAALTLPVGQSSSPAASALAWHPDIATHIAVARDDPYPCVQIWDLKKAMAPVRELQGHTKGVLGLSWCADDPTMLLSCGRDGRVICWNTETGDLTGEMPAQGNWVYDVQWAPRIPAVVATASFDSVLAVHAAQDLSSGSTKTAPPKWLRRPCGAVFGFGGQIARVTDKTVKIVTLPSDGAKTSAAERDFMVELSTHLPGTAERTQWIKNHEGWEDIASLATATTEGNRRPLLSRLGNDPATVEQAAKEAATPFQTIEDADFDKTVAKCLVSGRIECAVDLCLSMQRYDDAFAIAQLQPNLTQRVHEAYVASRGASMRFARYLGAIKASAGGIADLIKEVSSKETPWEEVLSLIAAYSPPQSFSSTAEQLGDALASCGKNEAASTCYVFSGNVNKTVEHWIATTTDKPQDMVHRVTLLEQTANQACCSKAFANVLSQVANSLANEGNFMAAIAYASRAAQIGNSAAAVVADRLKYLVPAEHRPKIVAPFTCTNIPDASSPECQMMATAGRTYTSAAPAGPASAAAPAQPEVRKAFADPNASMPPSNRTPSSVGGAFPPQRTTPQPTYPAFEPAPVQPVHTGRPVQPATYEHSGATPVMGTVMASGASVAPPPLTAATAPPQPNVPAAQPNIPPTTAPASITRSNPVPPRAAAAAAPTLNLSAIDVSNVLPTQMPIVSNITAAVAKVADKRKKEAVEKAAGELFTRLNARKVPDDAAAKLVEYSAALGTPAAKELWRKLSEAHWQEVQSYLNVKFLV